MFFFFPSPLPPPLCSKNIPTIVFFFPYFSFFSVLVEPGHGPGGGQPDLGQLDVDGLPVVVEGGGLEDDPGGAHQDGHREDPQEEPVQHHGHVLPVLYDLRGGGGVWGGSAKKKI